MSQINNLDVYKLAELRYGAKKAAHFPGPQLTNLNDFNNFCFNTVAEFVDPALEPLQHSAEGKKCQIAMIKQLALNGREHPGLKLRLPVVLSRPQYFKDAYLATGNIDEAYKIAVNSCIVNQSPGLSQTSCIQRCGDARDALLLSNTNAASAGIISNQGGQLQVQPTIADAAGDQIDKSTQLAAQAALVAAVPRDSAAVPRDSADVPRDSADVPRDSADVPRDSADVPRDSADVPNIRDMLLGAVASSPSIVDPPHAAHSAAAQHGAKQSNIGYVASAHKNMANENFEFLKHSNKMCGNIIFIIVLVIVILLLIYLMTNKKNGNQSMAMAPLPAMPSRRRPIRQGFQMNSIPRKSFANFYR